MKFFTKKKEQLSEGIEQEIEKKARDSVIDELKKQGIDYRFLIDDEFNELVNNRIEKLRQSVKQVGLTTALSGLLFVVTGGI